MTRFNRQEILPQIGQSGQGRLRGSRVLLVGCGALGSAAAEMLVRSGIGFLRLVDRDLVELSNLQRQVLFDERDAAENLPKSVAAARRLREINSEVEIDAIVADANAANIESFADVDLILDGTDNISTRYLLNDLCVRNHIPWIYGGCVGTEGRVWGIWPDHTACLRCIFPIRRMRTNCRPAIPPASSARRRWWWGGSRRRWRSDSSSKGSPPPTNPRDWSLSMSGHAGFIPWVQHQPRQRHAPVAVGENSLFSRRTAWISLQTYVAGGRCRYCTRDCPGRSTWPWSPSDGKTLERSSGLHGSCAAN